MVRILRKCAKGNVSKTELKEYCKNEEKLSIEVKKAVDDSLSIVTRDISGKQKGWVCHALYIALKSFWMYERFTDAAHFIIHDHPNSDCDTNACIAGMLFGAFYGYEYAKTEEYTKDNLTVLLEHNPCVREMLEYAR
jgi:ADP-ribosylglycohydrolase